METKELVEYLKKKYKPLAIVLHGSRARGKNRANSDWDIYLFVDKKKKVVDHMWNGQHLDIWPIQVPVSTEFFVDTFGPTLFNARVLFDTKDSLATKLVAEAQTFLSLGRKWTKSEYQNAKSYVERTLSRLEGTIEKPEVFFCHLGNFYQAAIQYYFQTQKKFTKPIYEAVELIQKEDNKYYKDLQSLIGSESASAKVKTAKKIYKKLFEKTYDLSYRRYTQNWKD